LSKHPLTEKNIRYRSLLEELCILSLLKKQEEETGGEKMRLNYMITENVGGTLYPPKRLHDEKMPFLLSKDSSGCKR
jgi:hypothetical protein